RHGRLRRGHVQHDVRGPRVVRTRNAGGTGRDELRVAHGLDRERSILARVGLATGVVRAGLDRGRIARQAARIDVVVEAIPGRVRQRGEADVAVGRVAVAPVVLEEVADGLVAEGLE